MAHSQVACSDPRIRSGETFWNGHLVAVSEMADRLVEIQMSFRAMILERGEFRISLAPLGESTYSGDVILVSLPVRLLLIILGIQPDCPHTVAELAELTRLDEELVTASLEALGAALASVGAPALWHRAGRYSLSLPDPDWALYRSKRKRAPRELRTEGFIPAATALHLPERELAEVAAS